ncbi:MAG TPA: 50S ribosomal protein L11 methyltransferase [Rhodanobacteraceae bacterium]
MPWLELQLTLDTATQPQAEAALEDFGALSVTLMDADADTPDEAAIFEPGVGETPLWRSLTLLALFDAGTERGLLAHALHQALPSLAPDQIAFRDVADQDWERAWMDRYKPMQFGRRLWIYPWNVEPPSEAAWGSDRRAARDTISNASGVALRATDSPVVVRLDPGLAFGTGTHPTTALCLEWLDGLDLAGKTTIDYGCGSGVLAIAALKLGAARAIGVDNDAQALTATRDNAARNEVAARLEVCLPDELPRDTQADVFVANILAGPLAELAPRFAALCKPGAPFALSGILAGQEAELLERYRACGFVQLHASRGDDWLRIDGVRE